MLCAALLVVAGCAADETDTEQADAPPLPENEIAIEDPWVRPELPGGASAMYFRIANGTTAADTLVEVRTPAADSISIHETVQRGDTTRMQPVGPVPVPAQERVAFEPGGRHIMLMELNQSLDVGNNLIVDVSFAEEGLKRVSVPIRERAPEAQP